jgi:hypothetical protein
MTDPSEPDQATSRELLLAEYKALWEYYHRLFAEWTTLTERYFKIVTLPGAAVAFLLVQGNDPLPTEILTAILVLIFLIGTGLYVTYAKECGNSNYYEAALERLRAVMQERGGVPELGSLNELRARRKPGNLGGIKAWRGATIALLNSGVGTAAIALAFGVTSPGAWVVKFITLVIAHTIAFNYFVSRYDASFSGTSGAKE